MTQSTHQNQLSAIRRRFFTSATPQFSELILDPYIQKCKTKLKLSNFIENISILEYSEEEKIQLLFSMIDSKYNIWKNKVSEKNRKYYRGHRTKPDGKSIQYGMYLYRENKKWAYEQLGNKCVVTGFTDGLCLLYRSSKNKGKITNLFRSPNFKTKPEYMKELLKCSLVTRHIVYEYTYVWGGIMQFPKNDETFNIFVRSYQEYMNEYKDDDSNFGYLNFLRLKLPSYKNR